MTKIIEFTNRVIDAKAEVVSCATVSVKDTFKVQLSARLSVFTEEGEEQDHIEKYRKLDSFLNKVSKIDEIPLSGFSISFPSYVQEIFEHRGEYIDYNIQIEKTAVTFSFEDGDGITLMSIKIDLTDEEIFQQIREYLLDLVKAQKKNVQNEGFIWEPKKVKKSVH